MISLGKDAPHRSLCTEIRDAFRVLDRDGNGFISKQELGMAMRSLGYMPSEVELAIIMQRLDMDGEFLCLYLLFLTIMKIKKCIVVKHTQPVRGAKKRLWLH